MLDVLLHVEIAIAEGGGSFGLGGAEQRGQFILGADNAHATSTAARGSLDNYRKPDLARPLHGLAFGGDDAVRSRQNRHARGFHRGASFFLFTYEPGDFGPCAVELDSTGFAYFGEVR